MCVFCILVILLKGLRAALPGCFSLSWYSDYQSIFFNGAKQFIGVTVGNRNVATNCDYEKNCFVQKKKKFNYVEIK